MLSNVFDINPGIFQDGTMGSGGLNSRKAPEGSFTRAIFAGFLKTAEIADQTCCVGGLRDYLQRRDRVVRYAQVSVEFSLLGRHCFVLARRC